MLFLLFTLTAAMAGTQAPLHLDFEASSREYERAAQAQARSVRWDQVQKTSEDTEVENIIAIGKRNLDWLKHINEHRDKPLSFTVPGSLGGIPITAPKKYSGALTIESFQKLSLTLLPEMKDVLIDGKSFTDAAPEPVDQYLKLGNQIDKIYQTAIRWQMMQPWLSWYTRNRQNDIRGYYFLKDITDLQAQLAAWSTLPADKKASYKEWLVSECFNTTANENTCQRDFSRAETKNDLWAFHQSYVAKAKSTFEELYDLQNARRDVSWDTKTNTARIAIQPQASPELTDFLTLNLQDEWKWVQAGWHLLVDFSASARVQVLWQPGVTPHVNGLGGDLVYMDSNAPLTEWDVQWTIRHEFGHVLGFPDCYVEFYDPTDKAMVTYQIDITDLMCSRAGKLQERHFVDMKKNYAR